MQHSIARIEGRLRDGRCNGMAIPGRFDRRLYSEASAQ